MIDEDQVLHEELSLQALPHAKPLNWVVRNAMALSKCIRVSFHGMEYQVEDIFREIEKCWNLQARRCVLVPCQRTEGKKWRELKRLS